MSKGTGILTGLTLLAAIWLFQLVKLTDGYFSEHMLRHMLLITVICPLLALGISTPNRNMAVSPLIASLIEFIIVWGWHVPALHDLARAYWPVALLEQATFLVAGLLLWCAVLRPNEALAGAGGMFLTSMHMTLLGALLILSPRLLYQAELCRLGGVEDQQLGGMIMLGIGTPIYLIAGLFILSGTLNLPEKEGAEK